jgi:signal transduction histidine kinase/CheY-like chemotaxis protein
MELERKANARVQLLARVATSLLASQQPRALLGELVGWFVEELGLRSCAIYARCETLDELVLAGIAGDELAIWPETLQPDGIAWAQSLLGPRVGPWLSEERPSVLAGLREPIAAFPIAIEGEVLGAMVLTANATQVADDFVAPLEFVCDQIAMALHRERLVQTLRQRTQDLADADTRKNEFLAMLGHELRNPLASLCYALELSRLPAEPGRERPDVRDVFARQLRPLQRLVDDLLEVSRISQGKLSLLHGPVVIADVVTQAVEQCAPLFEAKGHVTVVELPDERIEMMADGVRLTQIVGNLLHNAARYTDPGGRIEIAVARDGDDVVIRVRDNGRGVSASMLPRIFDLFVQADRTNETSQGGLGLGLTLVRKLVELHHGQVTATSDGVGRGSTFTVRIPIVSPPVESQIARTGAPVVDVGLDLVIVEDNDDARDLLQAYLTQRGHRVRVAHDGISGLACLRESPPALAFIDVGLPGLDGYELARRFRECCPQVSTCLLAVTGYGQAEDRNRALAAGFDQHLVKPVHPAEIDRLLREAARTASTEPV